MILQPVSSIFSPFSIALWDLPDSRPVHSLMLSSHLFLCLPCLLPPFTVPCKMVLARPDERETWPYHCSLRLFTMVRRSSCGPIACWIFAKTSDQNGDKCTNTRLPLMHVNCMISNLHAHTQNGLWHASCYNVSRCYWGS